VRRELERRHGRVGRRGISSNNASVSESIELATVLVTDLVGSTRLATSVGPGPLLPLYALVAIGLVPVFGRL
jgi:class 3 adenylate cyclase